MRTCATVLVIVQRELDSALIRLGRRRYARPVHAGSWREDRGMIEAQLFNGTILQFPDGTPDHTPLKTYNVSGILRAQIGGRGGIRTHGGLAPTAVFKTAALNRSATLP